MSLPSSSSDDVAMAENTSGHLTIDVAQLHHMLQHMFQQHQHHIRGALQEELSGKGLVQMEAVVQAQQRTQNVGFLNRWFLPQYSLIVFAPWILQSKNEELSKANTNLQHVLDEKLSVVEELRLSNNAVIHERDWLHREIEKLRHEMSQARRELSQERVHTKELNEKLASLRGMLIPSTSHQVIDSDVIQKFKALEPLILKIVKVTWDKKIEDARDLNEQQSRFFRRFRNPDTPIKCLENRMRGQIFHMVNKYILSRAHYGLAESEQELEQHLGTAEKYFYGNLAKDKWGAISEWRLATMKCADHVRASNSSVSKISEKVQKGIWDFFEPLPTKSRKRGEELIKQLCEESATLGLLMRKSGDHFMVEDFFDKSAKVQELQAYAEEYDEEMGASGRHGTIAYCLFGGLSKRPAEDPTKCMVLEKAQVVVYV